MNIDEISLSRYGEASMAPSPVNRMMTAFAADFRDDVDVNLGVGYVNEHTIPRKKIAEALSAVTANADKYRLAFNYGGAQGSANLIASLRRFILSQQHGALSKGLLNSKRIIVGASGATSLLHAAAQVLKKGAVVTSDPLYYIYCNYLERLGYKIIPVAEDHDGIQTELIWKKISAHLGTISFFYVTTVGNPTCNILSNARKQELVDCVIKASQRAGTKIPLFLDGAYDCLVHNVDMSTPASGMLYDSLGVVYELGTLSKILAPGLRIGYMVGPHGPLMDSLVQAINDIGFSAPLINQEIACYMLDNHADEQIHFVNEGYRKKAHAVRRWIEQYLGEECVDIRGGDAGFYFYVTFKSVRTEEGSPFFNYLARATGDAAIDGPDGAKNPRVVYIPGAYCVHPRGELAEAGNRQLRISYGYEELDKIEHGLKTMKEALSHCLSHAAG
jgi:DNA-binding transcriptional MocR family regulator